MIKVVGAASAVLGLMGAGLLWTAGDAAAYQPCQKTIPADHHSVSVICPPQASGTQFRVYTYICSTPTSGCGSTPVYGAWANWGGTSSVNAGSLYIDANRVYVQTSVPQV